MSLIASFDAKTGILKKREQVWLKRGVPFH